VLASGQRISRFLLDKANIAVLDWSSFPCLLCSRGFSCGLIIGKENFAAVDQVREIRKSSQSRESSRFLIMNHPPVRSRLRGSPQTPLLQVIALFASCIVLLKFPSFDMLDAVNRRVREFVCCSTVIQQAHKSCVQLLSCESWMFYSLR
jgi:hypothetical protein